MIVSYKAIKPVLGNRSPAVMHWHCTAILAYDGRLKPNVTVTAPLAIGFSRAHCNFSSNQAAFPIVSIHRQEAAFDLSRAK